MTIDLKNMQGKALATILVASCLSPFSSTWAVTEFDQDLTPDVIFGSGNDNGAFTTDRANGVELGLRAKLRYNPAGLPENTFNSNGDGTYTYFNRSRPDFPDGQRGEWNFEWSVNTDFADSSGQNLSALTYELGLDGDPGPGTDFLVFDPIIPAMAGQFFDHAIGDNTTGNGGGTSAGDAASYQNLIDNNNVAQNSWIYGFFLSGVLTNYNPRLEGTYDVYLEARDSGNNLVARTQIQILVVNPPLDFDQDITPEVIFGSGNINGAFTTDRRNDLEIGIRGKLRFNAMGMPENIFNSNGDGSYSFAAGVAPGQSFPTSVWAFDWSVNSNFNGAAGPNLDVYTYEIGLDGDPGLATDFLTFDPITAGVSAPFFDHAIGTNSTANGGGTSATDAATYVALLANNNVAQNSWRYDFFLSGPLAAFDPTLVGNYHIYILARDTDGVVVARDDIQILVGGAAGGNIANLALSMTTTATGTQLVGDNIDLDIVMSNNDLATAVDVVLTNMLPGNLGFVSGSCDDGTTGSASGQLASFNLEPIASGATTNCTLSVIVTNKGVINTTATVAASNEGDPSDNSDSVRLLGIIQSIAASGDMATPTDNDYTRINEVIQLAVNGDLIILEGTFDWTQSDAFASWTLGSDGIADNDDDYSILVPDGLSAVTLTAASPGSASIEGPGDLPAVDLEGFVSFEGTNPDWEISNLVINDFDLGIGMFFGGGGVNVYDNTRIVDNMIRMARDVPGSSEAGEGLPNIGIHFSFGDNQLIARNIIEIPGDAASTTSFTASSVGMQSNTSIGAYEGLLIEDNEIRVLFAAHEMPAFILGIWENGAGHSRNITVRNNRFVNLDPANDPALNNQEAFRIHSHSSATSTTLYQGNHVSGAAIAYAWLPGRFGADFTAQEPVEFISNTALDGGIGIKLDSNGAGNFRCNRIAGNTQGINNVTDAIRNSTADDNWWGCNAGPNMGACDSFDVGVTADSWLTAVFSIDNANLIPGETANLTLDVTGNSDGIEVTDCNLPETPVSFAAVQGNVTPADTTTVAGQAPAVYTAPGISASDTASASIDSETLQLAITVTARPDELFSDSFESP